MVIRKIVIIAVYSMCFLLTAATCHEAPSSPETATYWRLREVRRAIAQFEEKTGTIPQSLSVLCPDGAPCPAAPPGEPLVDAWGREFRYERLTGRDYVLTSAGSDGTYGTKDDITFATMKESRFVGRISGCYAVDFSWWDAYPSNQLELTSNEASEGVYLVRPLVSGHSDGVWWVKGDTVIVSWAAGDRQSILRLVPENSELSGVAEAIGHNTQTVIATPTACSG